MPGYGKDELLSTTFINLTGNCCVGGCDDSIIWFMKIVWRKEILNCLALTLLFVINQVNSSD